MNPTSEMHRLLWVEYDPDDEGYDPLRNIPGVAEALAGFSNQYNVEFLGGHETSCPTHLDNVPHLYPCKEVHGVLPSLLGYEPYEAFGAEETGFVSLAQTPSALLSVARFPTRKPPQHGGTLNPYVDKPSHDSVLRIDLSTDDPEAPMVTSYFLLTYPKE